MKRWRIVVYRTETGGSDSFLKKYRQERKFVAKPKLSCCPLEIETCVRVSQKLGDFHSSKKTGGEKEIGGGEEVSYIRIQLCESVLDRPRNKEAIKQLGKIFLISKYLQALKNYLY